LRYATYIKLNSKFRNTKFQLLSAVFWILKHVKPECLMSTIFMNYCLRFVLFFSIFVGRNLVIAQHAIATDYTPLLAQVRYGNMKVENALPLFSIQVNGKLALCSHAEKGEILLDVKGGNPPYNFLWNNLSTEQNRYNLNAGTYTVVITDRAGQTHTERIVIQPPFPLIAELVESKSPSCPNTKDGSASVKIKIGRGEPYRVEWSHGLVDALEATGLQAGAYEVKIFDKYNCSTTVAFELVAAAEPVAIQEQIQEPSCGMQNGIITLSVGGANAPYTFQWSNGATTSVISDLAAGEYSVEITDKQKCVWTKTYSLTSHSPMQVNLLEQKQPSCGNKDGAIEVMVSGGKPPFSFLWDNSASGTRLESLGAGVYVLKIKDGSGCELSESFRLEHGPSPSVNIQTQIERDCDSGESRGLAWVTIQGGAPPYQIKWNNGVTNKTEIEFFTTTELQVQVTDASGCSTISSLKVNLPNQNQLRQLEVQIKNLSASNEMAVQVNEAIFFTSKEERQFMAWEWDFGDGTTSNEETPVHRFLFPGTYTVVLKAYDLAACMETSSLELRVEEKTDWVVMPNAFSPNGDGLNDFFQPVLFGVTQFQLDIFNQWGEHLFAETGLDLKGWDGFYKGVLAPKGNYVYRISFTTNTGEKQNKSGYLALIR
jgi:gliding motility-associated-like protein